MAPNRHHLQVSIPRRPNVIFPTVRYSHDTSDISVNATSMVFQETEEHGSSDDSWEDDDVTSYYGDDKDGEEDDDASLNEAADQFFLEPGSPLDGMCGPASYAEFAANPYSPTDAVPDNDLSYLDSKPKKEVKSEYDSYFSIPLANSRKRKADSLVEGGTATRSRQETRDEKLARLTSNFDDAFTAIQNEELSSLWYLQELCAGCPDVPSQIIGHRDHIQAIQVQALS
ncbi:hypothetical protein F4819DRAFT_35977 [Hypoxylon fuscum]|nr:hypothetical protein F4819DRAFT_35977 [Hypoxylon fuscum]